MDTARKPLRVTSFDVAERAGVSQSTVSRALSGSSVISEATREKLDVSVDVAFGPSPMEKLDWLSASWSSV